MTFLFAPNVSAGSESVKIAQEVTLSEQIKEHVAEVKKFCGARRLSAWLFVAALLLIAYLPYGAIRI